MKSTEELGEVSLHLGKSAARAFNALLDAAEALEARWDVIGKDPLRPNERRRVKAARALPALLDAAQGLKVALDTIENPPPAVGERADDEPHPTARSPITTGSSSGVAQPLERAPNAATPAEPAPRVSVDIVRDGTGTCVRTLMVTIGEPAVSALPGDPAAAYVTMRCPTKNCGCVAVVAPDIHHGNTQVLCPKHQRKMIK